MGRWNATIWQPKISVPALPPRPSWLMDAGYLVCRPRWGKSWYRDFGLPNGSIPPMYRLFFFWSCFHPADPLDPPGSWMLATWYVGPGEGRAGTEILDCQMVAFHRGIDCVFFCPSSTLLTPSTHLAHGC